MNRKRYIQTSNKRKTGSQDAMCGVPWSNMTGSILGLLLLLIYVNDFKYVSILLESIMLDDDTNLFYAE